MQFLEKIKKDNEFLKKITSREYESPWLTAAQNIDKLIEVVENLDQALTSALKERDDAYDEIDKLEEKQNAK